MEKIDPQMLPPLPDNVEDCHKEIRRLYQALYNERVAYDKKLTKAKNDHKAANGELQKLRMKLSALPFDIESL